MGTPLGHLYGWADYLSIQSIRSPIAGRLSGAEFAESGCGELPFRNVRVLPELAYRPETVSRLTATAEGHDGMHLGLSEQPRRFPLVAALPALRSVHGS